MVAVLDGDTIIISGGEKVRYAGLNTPETHHPDKLPSIAVKRPLKPIVVW